MVMLKHIKTPAGLSVCQKLCPSGQRAAEARSQAAYFRAKVLIPGKLSAKARRTRSFSKNCTE